MHNENITDFPPHEFIPICAGWKADMEKEEKWDEIQKDIDLNVLKCPVHKYAQTRGLCKRTTGGTEKCTICGNYMCPECNSHAVDIMSRVTGYLQVVSGWNVAKKQEFEDRKRHKVP
jgi:anaerobic ribonucleoside-triphosphate reductase